MTEKYRVATIAHESTQFPVDSCNCYRRAQNDISSGRRVRSFPSRLNRNSCSANALKMSYPIATLENE